MDDVKHALRTLALHDNRDYRLRHKIPGACFLKDPQPFRARKAIFSSSVSKNGEVYTPETSCMKGKSLQNKNAWIKLLCNREVQDFAMASRARKVSGAFEIRAQGPGCSKAG